MIKQQDAQSLSTEAIRQLNLSSEISPNEQVVIYKFFAEILKSPGTTVIRTKSESGAQFEHQNIHILMKYLQSENQPGVIEFLINQLSQESMQNMDMYLP